MTDATKEKDLLARTLWGEARGEGRTGMQAVANVIMNRKARGGWYGATVADIVLKPLQFSVWNDNDPNKEKMLAVTGSDSDFSEAQQLAESAYNGNLNDLTRGATEYHTLDIKPNWNWDRLVHTVDIGNHRFYRSV